MMMKLNLKSLSQKKTNIISLIAIVLLSMSSYSAHAIDVYDEDHTDGYWDIFYRTYNTVTPGTAFGYNFGYRVTGGTGLTARLGMYGVSTDLDEELRLDYGLGYSYLLTRSTIGRVAVFAEREFIDEDTTCVHECSTETKMGVAVVGSRFEYKFSSSSFEDNSSGINFSIRSSALALEYSTVNGVETIGFVFSLSGLLNMNGM